MLALVESCFFLCKTKSSVNTVQCYSYPKHSTTNGFPIDHRPKGQEKLVAGGDLLQEKTFTWGQSSTLGR